MAISLSKGRAISLTKAAPGLAIVQAGLGWDPRETAGTDPYDLDASVLVCDANGRCLGEEWFIFYGNLQSAGGAVVHAGDNRTGDGDGDDEVVTLNLGALPPQAARLIFGVSIDEASARRQNFGQIRNSFIRLVDTVTGVEVARYDLDDDFATETAVVFGELQRSGSDWNFVAVGQGFQGGLAGLIAAFGLQAG